MVQLRGRGKRPYLRVNRRSMVTISIALSMLALLGACGQVDAASTKVSLLPDTRAKGKSWAWTAACQFGPSRPSGCDPSGPNLATSQLDGDEWNLGGGPATGGSVTMSVDSSGGLMVDGSLPSAPPCTTSACIASSANTWVRGYPGVLYGLNQCNAGTSPPESRELPLPISVASISLDLIGTTAYSSQAPNVTYDVAYDMWLSNSDTETPCKGNGTVEVMVWTDYDAAALLPDGMKAGTATIPFAVNGAVNSGNQAWSLYATNIYQAGATAPWGGTVWIVLNPADVVRQGTVTVDLSSALAAAGTLLQKNYGWSAFKDDHWLDTISFGMEFGPENADPYGSGSSYFLWKLTSDCLEVGATVAKAGC